MLRRSWKVESQNNSYWNSPGTERWDFGGSFYFTHLTGSFGKSVVSPYEPTALVSQHLLDLLVILQYCAFESAKMRIPFLSSILLSIIFEHPEPATIDAEKSLSWTIPTPQQERPTPAQNILQPRETASWTFPIANSIANEVFTIGSVVDVQWTTDFVRMVLYCLMISFE